MTIHERPGAVTFKGAPLTLIGSEVKVGDQIPEFTVLGNDLTPVTPSAWRGKVVVLVTVPSLDTPVCDLEIKRFNQEAGKLGERVLVVAASMDLPFAQARWCGAAGAQAIRSVSDHRQAELGERLGVLIKELRLLARAVFVIDGEGVIRYRQLVTEVTREPDYEPVLAAVRSLVR